MLVGDPACRVSREADRCPRLGFAGEDAVAGGEHLVEVAVGDVDRPLVQRVRFEDAIHREAAQCLAVVVPGIEIPVVAVVRQPLRRDRAPAVRIGGACAVAKTQLAAFEHGTGGDPECLLVKLALAPGDHADAFDR